VGAPELLVIGVGNTYRRDDGAGPAAARRLCEAAGAAASLCEATGEGTALIEAWAGAGTVVLIDAVSSGAPPGSIRRIDAGATAVPSEWFRGSTHAFGVAEAIELARTLGRLPDRLIVLGIEGARFDAGIGLSPEVAAAVEAAAQMGLAELTDRLGGGRGAAEGSAPNAARRRGRAEAG